MQLGREGQLQHVLRNEPRRIMQVSPSEREWGSSTPGHARNKMLMKMVN